MRKKLFLSIVKLPLLRLYVDTPINVYEVTDCEEAIEQINMNIKKHFASSYWSDSNLYGETCYKTYLDEDLDALQLIVEKAIKEVLVKPIQQQRVLK